MLQHRWRVKDLAQKAQQLLLGGTGFLNYLIHHFQQYVHFLFDAQTMEEAHITVGSFYLVVYNLLLNTENKAGKEAGFVKHIRQII